MRRDNTLLNFFFEGTLLELKSCVKYLYITVYMNLTSKSLFGSTNFREVF